MNLPVIQSAPPSDREASGNERLHLLDFSLDQLQNWLKEHGQPKFRAKQIFNWLYQKRAQSFEQMSDLPKSLRQVLDQEFVVFKSQEAAVQTSRDGTDKLLVRLADGGEVECVLLRDGHRRSICVSSQVGCAMGCVFCASGLDGVDRNLTRGEIVEQMLRLQSRLDEGERLSHIVMMGMGEPLANLNHVLGALDTAKSSDGLGISPRRITISTVGLPPAIDRLAASGVPYNLAVSLHAPNEELRSQLVPVNKKIGIDAVLNAADRYFEANGRRLTFEYVLLGGINDDIEHARQLARILRTRNVMLNVIPYNPVEGLPYVTPTKQAIAEFKDILEASGVNVMFRQRKGDEIDAACGQLRRNRGGQCST
ncbi:23S rRNA (adenine(2503)-C(2))-methyltransferase RlmN [Stieleria sp. JC731]|uniref:23S rRNA (adenine(2503)-C(2))-methyltransferase RlmN n=1 Tax=Pirellulaceae TaxID=2691357 RepID=UPI001E3FADFD|nr:23S rRNA (adenine(2503)-C(2))-methyltransferase RlmN [Stieleria sp. JC731]MCC9602515.1 23S rRNA (adenine(2503)-C(2))-methyltransferase RlmN [Stieleria sp. JC731]